MAPDYRPAIEQRLSNTDFYVSLPNGFALWGGLVGADSALRQML
jgi:hypothetical protein